MPKFKENLSIVWSVSRGRDTHGYNICRLHGENKSYKVMGGGYDMVGSLVGEYLTDLLTDEEKQSAVDAKLYGIRKSDNGFHIDGACGISSMKAIAEHAGYKIETTYSRDRKGRIKETNGFWFERDNI